MGAFFIIVVVIYLVMVLSRLSNDVKRMGYVNKFFQHFRLRRRGRAIYHGQSLSLTLSLIVPKLLCRLGRHEYSEQMLYLQRLEPGTVLRCERWFCADFHASAAN